MIDIGNRLKELRELTGQKQIDVATAVKIARNTLSQFENNIAKPSIDVLLSMANYYNCSVDYLLGREDDFGNIALPAAEQLPTDERELLSLYRSFSNDMKKSVLDTLKSMKSTFGFVEKRG